MNRELELSDLLTRELQPVPAPAGLWIRVEAGLDRPPVRKRSPQWAYAFAAVLLLAIGSLVWSKHASHADSVDLQSYLAPVQNASVAASGPAISLAPPHFRNAADQAGPASVAGYQVTARREAEVDGRPVKQMVLTAANESVALFIAPPRVPLQTGRNYWTDSHVAGIACKRLNCPRTRTVLFPCLKQTCVLVCKACSESAILALIRGVDGAPEILR